VLVAIPHCVATLIFPPRWLAGMVVCSCVVVAEVIWPYVAFSRSLSPAAGVRNPVPVTVIAAPAATMLGEKLVIAGAAAFAAAVKFVADVALPFGLVTAMTPVVAPPGTVTVSLLTVAAVTVPAAPLNVTVLLAGVALKPVPQMVTGVRRELDDRHLRGGKACDGRDIAGGVVREPCRIAGWVSRPDQTPVLVVDVLDLRVRRDGKPCTKSQCEQEL
jgi:hypothetical protein